jgi:tetratricopeptide (TPR) repeat protein
LFDSSDAGKRSEAQENVWALARDNSHIGLEALGFLARQKDLSPGQRRELITSLRQHPLSGFSEQLLVLDQQIRLEPGRRAEILDQAVADYKNSGLENLSRFAVWLNQHEEFQRTLDAVPLEAALKRKELFLPHMDALASLGRWEELDKILDTKPAPLEPVHSETFRARAAMKFNNAPSAALHWNRALRSAERNPEQLTWLAIYAEKCGEFDQAKKALRSLIGCVEDVRPAYRTLEELTVKTGTTVELRDLLGEMLNRWPKDPALLNDSAYLNLLLATKLPESRQAAEELVGQFPDSLPYRTTLALAFLRLKDHAAALRVYEGRQYEWRKALPGNRAVYAAVLAANGKDKEAREHVVSIPSERLREEELELIRPVL